MTALRLFWLLLLGAGSEAWFTGSEAYRDLRLSGREVAAEKMLDVDGDGLAEAIVAERSAEGIGLSVWRGAEKNRYLLLGRLPPSAGELLLRFELVRLSENTPALWLEVAEENPDEDDHHFRLVRFEPAPRVILDAHYRVQHSEQQAGRKERRVIWPGPDFQGVRFGQRPDGWPQITLLRHPRLVALRGPKEPVWLALGLEELVFSAQGQAYVLEKEGYLNLLPVLEGVNKQQSAAADGGQAQQLVVLRLPRPLGVRLVRLFFPCPRERAAELGEMVLFPGNETPLRFKPAAAPADPRLAGVGEFFQENTTGWQQLLLMEKPLVVESLKLEISGAGASSEICLPEVTLHRGYSDPER